MNAVTETKAAHTGLYAALAAAQSEMGKALKDTANPHFKSKYADLASVTDACMPALTRHGIAVLQPPYDDDSGRYVKTILVHGASGETAECRVPLIVQKNDMQGYGSAVTYARRYGLMCMAGIAPEDDDGNAAVAAAPKTQQPRAPAHRPDPSHDTPSPADHAISSLHAADTLDQLAVIFRGLPLSVRALPEVIGAKGIRKAELTPPPADDLAGDGIPF
jgi:hypothetical protein